MKKRFHEGEDERGDDEEATWGKRKWCIKSGYMHPDKIIWCCMVRCECTACYFIYHQNPEKLSDIDELKKKITDGSF